jgi:hypothetical protein
VTVSIDISYQEAYNEMRRYRDKQQDYAKWFVSVCLAVFAGIIAVASQDKGVFVLSEAMFPLSGIMLVFPAIIIYQIMYMDDRYHELRKRINPIEPEWKKTLRKKTTLKPTEFLIIQVTLLTIFLQITIFTVIK